MREIVQGHEIVCRIEPAGASGEYARTVWACSIDGGSFENTGIDGKHDITEREAQTAVATRRDEFLAWVARRIAESSGRVSPLALATPAAPTEIAIEVAAEHRFVRITYRGPVSAPHIHDVWAQLANDPRGALGFDTLIDLRGAEVSLSDEDLSGLARIARRLTPSRRAVVAERDPDHALLCMLELRSGGGRWQYAIFRSMAEACAWLGNAGCAGCDLGAAQ